MEALELNPADWFILVVLIASGIISFTRGFTKEFLSSKRATIFLIFENSQIIFPHPVYRPAPSQRVRQPLEEKY